MKTAYSIAIGIVISWSLFSCKRERTDCPEDETIEVAVPEIIAGKRFTATADMSRPGMKMHYTWSDAIENPLASSPDGAEVEYIIYRSDEQVFFHVQALHEACEWTTEKDVPLTPVMPPPACNLPANSLQWYGRPLETGIVPTILKNSDSSWLVRTGTAGLEFTFTPSEAFGAYVADKFYNTTAIQAKVEKARFHMRATLGSNEYNPVMAVQRFPEANIFLYDYENGKRALIACDLYVTDRNGISKQLSFHLLLD